MEKEVGDKIRAYHLDGVKVDEDFRRYYSGRWLLKFWDLPEGITRGLSAWR